jgi:hypothetical protein
MRAILIILALAAAALAAAPAMAEGRHTATVRAKSIEEAQGFASDICAQYGKRAYFMFKEPGSDGLTTFYFACR